jgi:hypothetical protein
VAAELRPLAGEALPEIPAEAEEVEEAFDALKARTAAREGARRSSRLGGAILLTGLGILVAVILVLVLSGGGGSSTHTSSQPTSQPSGTTGGTPQVLAQVNLVPPRPGHALGVANVLAQGSQRALAIQAQGLLPSSTHSFYAVWLVNTPTDAQRLGFAPPVGRDGRLQAVSALPTQAPHFHSLVITRETQSNPSRPGEVILSGRLSLPGG